MKREIKFRGKSIDSGEWLYGDLYTGLNDSLYIRHFVNTKSESVLGHEEGMLAVITMVHKDSAGEITGLHDKNGTEIYEGDIFQYDLPCEDDFEQETYIESIIFNDGCFEVEGMALYTVNSAGEVIGNVFENPELLP